MQLQTDDVSTERLEAYKKDNSEFMHVSSVEAKLHIVCDEATEDDLSVVFYDLSRIGVSNLFIYTFHIYQSQYKRLELHFFCILESSFFFIFANQFFTINTNITLKNYICTFLLVQPRTLNFFEQKKMNPVTSGCQKKRRCADAGGVWLMV